MSVIDTIVAFNKYVNGELNDSENRVNILSHYKIDGTTYIHVIDESKDYELKDGEWQEQPPF